MQARWWCRCSGSTDPNTQTSAARMRIALRRFLQASIETTPPLPALKTSASSWPSMSTAGEQHISSHTNIFPLLNLPLLYICIFVSDTWSSRRWLTRELHLLGILFQNALMAILGAPCCPPAKWPMTGSSSVGKFTTPGVEGCWRTPTEEVWQPLRPPRTKNSHCVVMKTKPRIPAVIVGKPRHC